jgi:hypothetical protein
LRLDTLRIGTGSRQAAMPSFKNLRIAGSMAMPPDWASGGPLIVADSPDEKRPSGSGWVNLSFKGRLTMVAYGLRTYGMKRRQRSQKLLRRMNGQL